MGLLEESISVRRGIGALGIEENTQRKYETGQSALRIELLKVCLNSGISGLCFYLFAQNDLREFLKFLELIINKSFLFFLNQKKKQLTIKFLSSCIWQNHFS